MAPMHLLLLPFRSFGYSIVIYLQTETPETLILHACTLGLCVMLILSVLSVCDAWRSVLADTQLRTLHPAYNSAADICC